MGANSANGAYMGANSANGAHMGANSAIGAHMGADNASKKETILYSNFYSLPDWDHLNKNPYSKQCF